MKNTRPFLYALALVLGFLLLWRMNPNRIYYENAKSGHELWIEGKSPEPVEKRASVRPLADENEGDRSSHTRR